MKVDMTRVLNLVEKFTTKIDKDFSNFNILDRKKVKDKLNIKSVDTYEDLPSEPISNDVILVLDAKGDTISLDGKWALYWYINESWERIMDQNISKVYSASDIVSAINNSEESIDAKNLGIDLSGFLTADNLINDKVVLSNYFEAYTLSYKSSKDEATMTSFNPETAENDLIIYMPGFDYINNEHGLLYINGVAIPSNTNILGVDDNHFGKYHVEQDTEGKVKIIVHRDNDSQGFINYEISSSDIIGFMYPRTKTILS